MNTIEAIGATCLGIVIGWLVRYFILRFKTFTPQALGAVISIITGSIVMRFLAPNGAVFWFYPIGLLLGFIIYSVIAALTGGRHKDGVFFESKKGKSLNL